MGPHKRLAHVVLQTTALAPMKAWYLKVLDAHVVHENDYIAFITFDDEHHRVAIMQIPGLQERSPITVGLAHAAYTFDTLDELLAKYQDLAAAGIAPRAPVQHGVTTSLYYRDPDENMVELQIDNFSTPEQATAYMCGEEYSSDPIGPTFDPEGMVAALAAGVPRSELTSRAWARTTPQGNVVELLLT